MTDSRQKGKRGELEVAQLFRAINIKACRSQQFSGKGMGPGDVILHDLNGHPLPTFVEVKRREVYSSNQLLAWVEQASQEAGSGNVGLVIHRKSKQPWQVTFLLSDMDYLLEDLRQLWE